MPNPQAKTFFLDIAIKSAVKCQIFRRRLLFLVRWNGVGPLELAGPGMAHRTKRLLTPSPYFWAHVDGSPGYNGVRMPWILVGLEHCFNDFSEGVAFKADSKYIITNKEHKETCGVRVKVAPALTCTTHLC